MSPLGIVVLIVLIAFAIFWHLTTGEWRQYLPTRENLRAQAEYYVIGVFRGAPHPTRKTVLPMDPRRARRDTPAWIAELVMKMTAPRP